MSINKNRPFKQTSQSKGEDLIQSLEKENNDFYY